MRSTSRRGGGSVPIAVVAGLAALAGLAGCSGSDGSPSPTGTTATGAGPSASSPAASGVAPTPARTRASAGTQGGVASTPRPAKIGQSADLGQDVRVQVGPPARVRLTANGPGEIAGPGARVAIRVTNASGKPVDLGLLAVNAYYGRHKTPASASTYKAGSQLAGKLKPAASAAGTYYFRVPPAQFPTLDVEVSSGQSPYVLTFQHT